MRFGLKIATVLLGFVATALSGCAAVGSVQPNPLDGTSWLLVSLEERAPIAGTEIAVVFEAGSVQGSSGCNHFGASYRISGDRIEIREIESTLMGCIEPEGAMEQEQAFVGLLRSSERYQFGQGRLQLMRSEQVLLEFVPDD